MSTRLERLFVLLSSASTDSTRTLAARQLGNVIKNHPGELPNLLAQIHPLLRSTSWDTRTAARQALESVMEALPKWDPTTAAVKAEEAEEASSESALDHTPSTAAQDTTCKAREKLKFSSFQLKNVLNEANGLTASHGQEFQMDDDQEPNVEDQRKDLNSKLGLVGAAKLDDIITNEDLGQNSVDKSISARERNRLKRNLSKQKSLQAKAKKQKLTPRLFRPSDVDENSPNWPLEEFCALLTNDLFENIWEIRHGAAMAIREIVRIQGEDGGKVKGMDSVQLDNAHDEWMEDLSLCLVSVIARDRFGDFVSDQVVAPVKESAAQALGSLVSLMSEEAVINIVKLLLELMTNESSWHCRHAGILGIKYVLSVRFDLTKTLLRLSYVPIFRCLKDEVDDVVGVAATSLQFVVHGLNQEFKISELVTFLWESLKDVDELTASTESILQLLSEILKQENSDLRTVSSSTDAGGTMQDVDKVPLLFPFLSHSSSNVRKAALSTLDTLVSNFEMSQTFLPRVIGPLLMRLFERALLEHQEFNLKLIEKIWNTSCDFTPLGPLLMAACPQYGNWVSLIVQPPSWPLPPHLLSKSAALEYRQYLGGPQAQHLVDAVEKDHYIVKARLLGAKLLGKLAGFIVQPVPGMDYSQDAMPPMDMFVSKIILPNLCVRSAYARLTVSLIVTFWCEEHNLDSSPLSLIGTLSKFLSEAVTFEESIHSFAGLGGSTIDFVATLKHHKFRLPEHLMNSQGRPEFMSSLDEIRTFLFETDFKSMVTNSKLRSKVIQQVLERVEESLIPAFHKIKSDQESLSIMTLSSIAGAVIGLGILPDKLNPVIKPVMESIKKEPNIILQRLSCRHLAKLMKVSVANNNQAPIEKILKNLIAFASTDTLLTPIFQPDLSDEINSRILTLTVREAEASKKEVKRGKSKREKQAVVTSMTVDSNNLSAIQTRGSKLALETIVNQFDEKIFETLPKLQELTIGTLLTIGTEQVKSPSQILFALRALEIIICVAPNKLMPIILQSLSVLCELIKSEFSSFRHLAARCLGELSKRQSSMLITAVVNNILPLLESHKLHERQGAVECISWITSKMDLDIVPFIILMMVPILGRMSDQNEDTRLLSTNTFASLIKLYPLEGSVPEPDDMDESLLKKKAQEKRFMDQLLNVKAMEDYPLEIKVDASLRAYQVDGVNWLGFLNRYKLHGILCDDMGLGKTLQTICVVTNDHHLAMSDPNRLEYPSLIICPPTLCTHWETEIKKFVLDHIFNVLVYSGTATFRQTLRHRLAKSNLVITSYDVIRNDLEVFCHTQWNYVVLDEGQVIKNGKTKTTLAVKKLKSNHRLVLSGTPIQNSVLELWSLFDFLMPGYLGTEKQFAAKYSRPIVASRDAKSSSKDQEAGALAMEALHKQVLPFVLRRMKDDVLDDLPPKITQDFYCDLSPLQVKLYEDFAKKHTQDKTDETSKNKTHVFQALQYLRKVCNHPKVALTQEHQEYSNVMRMLQNSGSSLDDINHSAKLPALRDLLLQCGIGTEENNGSGEIEIAFQHRALIFFQLKHMMDIVETDLLKKLMPNVTYLRLDGSVPARSRQALVDKFNHDVSIDVLLLSTSIGGLGLNLTGADTVIFVEHDWNPMKDLQAMDRAHRIGQKKVVNVYRLITKNTIEEKIMGLQQFKLKTAKTVISSDNSNLNTMKTDHIFDLFSLDDTEPKATSDEDLKEGKKSLQAILEEMPEIWDENEYTQEFDMNAYLNKNKKQPMTCL